MFKKMTRKTKTLLIVFVTVLLIVSFFPKRQNNDIKAPEDVKHTTYINLIHPGVV